MWKNDCKKTGKDVERRGDGLFYDPILPFHWMNVGTTEQNRTWDLWNMQQRCYLLDHISRIPLTYQSLECWRQWTMSLHHNGLSNVLGLWNNAACKFWYTLPSDLPSTEFRTKSGGARTSTNATASGFSLENKSKIPPLTSWAGSGPTA